ncbi:MAG: phosphoribosylformylglycinamidine synthase subunit PurL [Bacillota bacterium]|nr:phosphoribosylformylglycinamidine synthase subunit PurL [Bacillota bacterium]
MATQEEIRRQKLWRAMGLRDEEYQRIVELLGREPNYVELGMYAVLWSEHCAYKHTRRLFRHFPTDGPRVLEGPGENAGAVSIGDGQAIVMKVESHNHPSAIEPYQGAATGVGGILRDIFTMGARPIALLDSLRFGELSSERSRYLFQGVVAGIAGYGNATGVPTVGGEVYFDAAYEGNPLVNVMCVGLVDEVHLTRARASGVGNPVLVVGAHTGRDGIHGATFASAQLDEDSASRRPSVQVGDPFTEKLLIEACLEVIQRGLVVGIQDMGAAGLTSAAAEMAARAGSGIELDVALVPRREEGMTPYEVMLSESQERMLVVPRAGAEEEVAAVFARWGLVAARVGRVTDDGLLRVLENGRVVAEVPAASLSTQGAPAYEPEAQRPAYLDEVNGRDLNALPVPADPGQVLLELLSSPTLADRSWIYQQYDHMVQINTVAGPGGDAAVLRIKGTPKGIALTIDGNGRYTYLDPRTGAALAVAEAARNLACVGAEPLAATDGLNFGNPEKPEVFWQLREAILGIAEACRALEIPVISGNASMYNENEGVPIYPTPIIGMVGLLPEVERRVGAGFVREGDLVVLLGENRLELGGSEYLYRVHGLVAGPPPTVNLAEEKRLLSLCLAAARRGMVRSLHDCSEGGLAVAVAECCLLGGCGAELTLFSPGRPDALLFGEAQGRVVASLPETHWEELQRLAAACGVRATLLGRVGGRRLVLRVHGDPGVEAVVDLSLQELEETWRSGLAGRL